MSTATETAEKQYSAAEIKKDLKVNDKGKTESPDDLYSTHLPEGFTMESINRLRA